jgi:hypothetical protein
MCYGTERSKTMNTLHFKLTLTYTAERWILMKRNKEKTQEGNMTFSLKYQTENKKKGQQN